jgi:hypothetical protein
MAHHWFVATGFPRDDDEVKLLFTPREERDACLKVFSAKYRIFALTGFISAE